MGKGVSIGTISGGGSGDNPVRVLEANLAGEVSRFLKAVISPDTTSAYSTGLNVLEPFWINGNISNTLPPPPDQSVNFKAHLSINGYAEPTAGNNIAAIWYHYKINGYLHNK